MPIEHACRQCGRLLRGLEQADHRLVCCLACGWQVSIPLGEPLTLELADRPEARPVHDATTRHRSRGLFGSALKTVASLFVA